MLPHRPTSPPRRYLTIFSIWLFVTVCLSAAALSPTPLRAQDPAPTETPIGAPVEAPTATLPPPEFQPQPGETSIPIDPNAAPPATITPDPNAPPPAEAPTAQVEIVATPAPLPPPPLPTDEPVIAVAAGSRRVQFGETLASIAIQTGKPISELARLNALSRIDFLVTNQDLSIPEPVVSTGARMHLLTPGDTLSSLAAQYGVPISALRKANALACASCLVTGQTLIIPALTDAAQASSLPAPFTTIQINPNLPRQGDIIAISVTTDSPLQSLVGTLAGRPLSFVQKNGVYMALTGVGAVQDAGVYSMTLRGITAAGVPSGMSGRVLIGAGQFAFENLVVGPQLTPLLADDINKEERVALDGIFKRNFTGAQYWSGPFALPIKSARFVSYYGTRRNFNRGTLNTFHSGVDMSASIGTPISAAAPGKVIAVQPFPIRGNVVIVDHGRGVFTIYCHMSKFKAQLGDIVQTGDVLGYTGSTGRSLGPHLHFELSVGGVTVNPIAWLQREIP